MVDVDTEVFVTSVLKDYNGIDQIRINGLISSNLFIIIIIF